MFESRALFSGGHHLLEGSVGASALGRGHRNYAVPTASLARLARDANK